MSKRPWTIPEIGDEFYRGSEEVEGKLFLVGMKEAVFRAVTIAGEAFAIAPNCESPIEVHLGAYLSAFLPQSFRLAAQYRFGRFRMDFAILDSEEQPRLFVECDGKEFHSTVSQIANDRAKDAAAAKAKIPLLRFTGKEIFRDPLRCVTEIRVRMRELSHG